eukprot:scaffold18750_cov113-Isochrysis_galbana.AAC.5
MRHGVDLVARCKRQVQLHVDVDGPAGHQHALEHCEERPGGRAEPHGKAHVWHEVGLVGGHPNRRRQRGYSHVSHPLALVKEVDVHGVEGERDVEGVGGDDERLVVQVAVACQLPCVCGGIDPEKHTFEYPRTIAALEAGQLRLEGDTAKSLRVVGSAGSERRNHAGLERREDRAGSPRKRGRGPS